VTNVPREIQEHYDMGLEDQRLEFPEGVLERIRTEELLTRHLPAPPVRIADVGGEVLRVRAEFGGVGEGGGEA